MNNTCNNYLDTYINRSTVWEECQDIYWMFVMLDDSGYSNSVESEYPLRQYACNLTHSYWNLLYPDLKKAIEIVEKNTIKKHNSNIVMKRVNSLIETNYVSPEIEPALFNSLKLAEGTANLYISGVRAAAIASTYALKLGETHATLAENLRDLIGNPYLITSNNTISRNWWVEPPRNTSIVQSVKFLCKDLVVEARNYKQRRDFNHFLNQYHSLSEAWENCPNPSWMLAMIDIYTSFDYQRRIQNELRTFICFVVQQGGHYSFSESITLETVIETAKKFNNNEADLKDLKIAEILIDISGKYFYYLNSSSHHLILLCVSPLAWDAAVKCVEISQAMTFIDGQIKFLRQAVELRKLVENPFL